MYDDEKWKELQIMSYLSNEIYMELNDMVAGICQLCNNVDTKVQATCFLNLLGNEKKEFEMDEEQRETRRKKDTVRWRKMRAAMNKEQREIGNKKKRKRNKERKAAMNEEERERHKENQRKRSRRSDQKKREKDTAEVKKRYEEYTEWNPDTDFDFF